jgi:hypothetical protein
VKNRFQNLPFKFNLQRYVSGPSLAQLESTLGDLRAGVGKLEGECDACSGGGGGGNGDEAAYAAALAPFRATAAGLYKLNSVDP